MKKQLVSILFALCMVLCLVPLAAFAEGETENMREVTDQTTLVAAMADTSVTTVKLAADIDIDATLKVDRTVTLDLNGQVLKYVGESKGSVIVVEDGGNLTLMDSNDEKVHNFDKSVMPWALAADDATGENIVAVPGGVITGGTGHPFQLYSTVNCGGGVYIAPGGQLTMTGGNIIGCSAEFGGGVCIYPRQGAEASQFSMSGGSIIGCVASNSGGGVFASGKFQMSGKAVIRSCTAEGTSFNCGGGVYVDGSFEMSGEAIIEGCQAISEYAYGGGVFVNSSRSFVMSEKAKIEGCQAISTPSSPSKGGGVHLANNTEFTLSGNAVIQNCTATNSANSGEAYGGGVSAACVKEITLADSARIVGCAAANGSGLYITGSQVPGYGKLFANGGSVDGDVVLGDTEDGPSTITGSGGTVFNGKVTVTPGSTIESGIFNGEVINNGTITGGTFSGGITGNPALATGSGTETDPYQIGTAEGLKRFRDIVNGSNGQTQNRGAYAVLTADIDLNNEPWTPIGPSGSGSYTGTFDGKGHTIKNLNVSSSETYVGLFGFIGPRTISSTPAVVQRGAVRNLTVVGKVTGTGQTGQNARVGGIAGAVDDGLVANCANLCIVENKGSGSAGGIAGYVYCVEGYQSSLVLISDCYNVGTITGANFVGGIAGRVDFYSYISNCYNAGQITGQNTGEITADVSDHLLNCYYLSDTDTDTVPAGKTAAQFADGTVLKLLKDGERDNNADPWANECKYLESAGMTLPVFAGQKLTVHDHVWSAYTTDTAAKTHTHSCACGVAETEACTITPATCKDGSACAVCGQQYGGPDTGKHADLQHFPAVAATTDAEGNKEYWYCGGCGKYFADAAATREITRADTVTAKLPQPTTPPTATPTAAPTAQAAEQPRRTAQPTVQPTAAPTVQPVSTIPATGDTSSPILWAALLLCSGAGLAVTAYKKNRHRS